jgi:hypothetical protein
MVRHVFEFPIEVKYGKIWVLLQEVFITGREKTSVILRNRQCCERRNFKKIEIFNHKFKNEKIA